MADAEIPHALVRFTFEHFENTFASPPWWEALDSVARDKLLDRMSTGTSTHARLPNCLLDDGLRIVNWGVTARETNIDF